MLKHPTRAGLAITLSITLVLLAAGLFALKGTIGGQHIPRAFRPEPSWAYKRIFILQPEAPLSKKVLNAEKQRVWETLQLSEYYSTQLNEVARDGWELLTVSDQVAGLATYWKKPADRDETN